MILEECQLYCCDRSASFADFGAIQQGSGQMETSRQPEPPNSVGDPTKEVGRGGAVSNDAPDRRRGHRRRVLKSALIVFNNGHCTLSCQILDVSDTGALVMPADIFLCPGEF